MLTEEVQLFDDLPPQPVEEAPPPSQAKKVMAVLEKPSLMRYAPVALMGLLLANLFVSCSGWLTAGKLIRDRPYIYVHNAEEGTAVKAKAVDHLHREPAIVTKFAKDWLTLAYTWQLKGLKTASVRESGYEFPAPFHAASLALMPGFREGYLPQQLAKYAKDDLNMSRYLSGSQESYIKFHQEPILEEIKPGLWNVSIISTRVHAQGSAVFANEVFNFSLKLQAVPPSKDQLWGIRKPMWVG